jgi:hypothetical protein
VTSPDTLTRRQRLDLAEKVARQRYPGAVGELLAREIHGSRQLAYLGDTDSLLGAVVDDLTRPPVILWDGPGDRYTPAGFAPGYDFVERDEPVPAADMTGFLHYPHQPARRRHWFFRPVRSWLAHAAWFAVGVLVVLAAVYLGIAYLAG